VFKTKHFQYIKFISLSLLVIALAACPNPMGTDPELDEEGRFETTRHRQNTTFEGSDFFPESKHAWNAVRDYKGWSFTPVAKSEDGKIVVGNAVHAEGYDKKKLHVDAGTEVAVYWIVGTGRRGRDPRISSPRVLGVPDPDSVTGSKKTRRRIIASLRSKKGLFYLDKYSEYMNTVGSVEYDDETATYKALFIIGETTYIATIDRWKVTGIEVVQEPVVPAITRFSFFPEDNNSAPKSGAAGKRLMAENWEVVGEPIDGTNNISVTLWTLDGSVLYPLSLRPRIELAPAEATVSPRSGATITFDSYSLSPNASVDYEVELNDVTVQYTVLLSWVNPDRDQDGLYNKFETDIFDTNPDLADTDGDGTLDGQEDHDGDGTLNSAHQDQNLDVQDGF
jgi:hypothetical protein